MRIFEDSPTRLRLRDRLSVGLALINYGVAAVLAAVALAKGELGLLGTSALFAFFGLFSVDSGAVTFDRIARVCEIRKFSVAKRLRRRLAFAEVRDVKVEGMMDTDSSSTLYRLSLVTASEDLPLAASYQTGLERHEAMRERILAVITDGAPQPAAWNSAVTLAAEGRTLDAIVVLRREGYGLSAARDLVKGWQNKPTG